MVIIYGITGLSAMCWSGHCASNACAVLLAEHPALSPLARLGTLHPSSRTVFRRYPFDYFGAIMASTVTASSTGTQESITLLISKQIFPSGSVVQGEVELNFPLIQEEQLEEIHVKFRGSVLTIIGLMPTELTETLQLDLVHDEISLWTRGSAYPPPGSHTLRLPFAFTLPANVPPSYKFSKLDKQGLVRYLIEAVGVRPGALRMNKRVFCPIAVLPVDPAGARVRAALQPTWNGSWTSIISEKQIRAGLWGGHANVNIEFKHPAISVFPLFTPIPFAITVTTVSKTSQRTETKSIWPAPPVDPKDVRFELRCNTDILTHHLSWQQNDKVASLGGMNGSPGQVDIKTEEKEWIPSSPGASRGQWKQMTTFSSTFVLTCPPTFKTSNLSIDYKLLVQVQFSGWQNGLSVEAPVTVTSGIVPHPGRPPPSYADYTAPPSQEPDAIVHDSDHALHLANLDLPPSYWNTADLQ